MGVEMVNSPLHACLCNEKNLYYRNSREAVMGRALDALVAEIYIYESSLKLLESCWPLYNYAACDV